MQAVLPGILAAQAGASAVSMSFCVAVAALVYAPRKGDTPSQPMVSANRVLYTFAVLPPVAAATGSKSRPFKLVCTVAILTCSMYIKLREFSPLHASATATATAAESLLQQQTTSS
eukprot:11534-Heterococcus_DN1.PRE.6